MILKGRRGKLRSRNCLGRSTGDLRGQKRTFWLFLKFESRAGAKGGLRGCDTPQVMSISWHMSNISRELWYFPSKNICKAKNWKIRKIKKIDFSEGMQICREWNNFVGILSFSSLSEYIYVCVCVCHGPLDSSSPWCCVYLYVCVRVCVCVCVSLDIKKHCLKIEACKIFNLLLFVPGFSPFSHIFFLGFKVKI